ncbi:heterokaryon incompatibility protein-domain-containing protein [Bisporella sp. PMI_857]|nr:heterokaryon incompatibility protein-domain-containing protein [Bisporella sp. PMI_857]
MCPSASVMTPLKKNVASYLASLKSHVASSKSSVETELSCPAPPTKPFNLEGSMYGNPTLSLDKDEIRVLRLHPATNWDDQIECSLITLSLSDPERPQYQALSYVWGDPQITLPIKVNGLHFEGTKNLIDALRALRFQGQERIIWIDAICINQKDIQERNQQVKKMADIYRNSSATVAWLGSSAKESDKRPPEPLYDAIEDRSITDTDLAVLTHEARNVWPNLPEDHPLLQGPFVQWKFAEMDLSLTDSFRTFRVMASQHFNILREFNQPGWAMESYLAVSQELRIIMKCLEPICNVPWWSRVWTAQETILPKTLYFMSGPYTLSFRVLDQACSACANREVVYTALENSSHSFDLDLSLLRNYIGNMASVNRFRALLHNGQDSLGLDIRWQSRNSQQLCLRELFGSFSVRLATDPKDKVFGVLGLASPTLRDEIIQPDYNLTTSQVYQLAVVLAIKASKHFDIVPVISSSRALNLNLETDDSVIPSWLPNWETSEREQTDGFSEITITREWAESLMKPKGNWIQSKDDAGYEGPLKLYSDGVLEIQGARIARITNIAKPGQEKGWNATIGEGKDNLPEIPTSNHNTTDDYSTPKATMRLTKTVQEGDEVFFLQGCEYLVILRPHKYKVGSLNTWPRSYRNGVLDPKSRPSKFPCYSWVCMEVQRYLNRSHSQFKQWERVPLQRIFLQ